MKRLPLLMLLLAVTAAGFAQPAIIAHRGASADAPENTVSAANVAWKQNADAVEIDIHLSKDNRVMVIHDDNTKRTTGEDFKVSNTLSEDLRMLDAGSFKNASYQGEKIPFLEEVITTIPNGKTLVIEIKSGLDVLPQLQAVIGKSEKQPSCKFISFSWDAIVAAKKLFPNNECYWLSSKRDGLIDKMAEAVAAGLDGLDLHYKVIDDECMKAANRNNLKIIAWTVDSPEEALRLANLGVSGITTNKPKLMIDTLK